MICQVPVPPLDWDTLPTELYASDPDWKAKTGQIWRIDRDGSTHLLASDLGTTNGIDVSPDGKTLYVNESVQRAVWAFPIKADGSLGERAHAEAGA